MPKRIISIWPPQKLKPEEDAQLGREKIALVQTKYKISTWNLLEKTLLEMNQLLER